MHTVLRMCGHGAWSMNMQVREWWLCLFIFLFSCAYLLSVSLSLPVCLACPAICPSVCLSTVCIFACLFLCGSLFFSFLVWALLRFEANASFSRAYMVNIWPLYCGYLKWFDCVTFSQPYSCMLQNELAHASPFTTLCGAGNAEGFNCEHMGLAPVPCKEVEKNRGRYRCP